MEEIEIASWMTLDALKKTKSTDIVDSVGNLQTGHSMSVFCRIEDDYLELCYSDMAANSLRRYEDRAEFEEALEERREEVGDAPYEEDEDHDFKDKNEDDDDVEGDEEGNSAGDFGGGREAEDDY
jgi:hypothetical protein